MIVIIETELNDDNQMNFCKLIIVATWGVVGGFGGGGGYGEAQQEWAMPHGNWKPESNNLL